MQKWEYKIESNTWLSSFEYILNDVGEEGWELVGIYREDGTFYAVLKRPR